MADFRWYRAPDGATQAFFLVSPSVDGRLVQPALTAPALSSSPETTPARLVGIQFRRAAALVHDYLAGDLDLPHDTRVVVDTDHGEALAWTVGEPMVREPHQEGPLRRVLRVATRHDLDKEVDLAGKEREVLRHCALRARQLGLDMKLVAVEWQHSGGRVVVYFSSETRVDFRALVKELAQKYRCRVEMRQVGPRDEAKIIGAMGPCGRETCCSSWLRAFAPVTIKMAKDQGLALNPQKTMGVCGRLLCCLSYEQDTYTALRKQLPRVGKQVETPKGPGRVVDVFALRGSVRVALNAGGPWIEVMAADVRPMGSAPAAAPPAEAPQVVEKPARPREKPAAPVADKPAARPAAPAKPAEGRSRRRTRSPQAQEKQKAPAQKPAAQKKPPVQKPAAPKPPAPTSEAKPEGEGRHKRRRRRGRGGGGGGPPGGDSAT